MEALEHFAARACLHARPAMRLRQHCLGQSRGFGRVTGMPRLELPSQHISLLRLGQTSSRHVARPIFNRTSPRQLNRGLLVAGTERWSRRYSDRTPPSPSSSSPSPSSSPSSSTSSSSLSHPSQRPRIQSFSDPLSRTSTPPTSVHENIYTLPNALTVTRLIAAPAVGYFLVVSPHPTLALGLFAYAGVTDWVDGYLARRRHSQTVIGTILDPMADKALMTFTTVALSMRHAIPLPLAVVIIGRDVLLALSAMYYRYISLPPHQRSFASYWDFSLPSAEVTPTAISKVNTFLQLGLLTATLAVLAVEGDGEAESVAGSDNADAGSVDNGPSSKTTTTIQNMAQTYRTHLEKPAWYIVGLTTVASGMSYVRGRKGLRILTPKTK